MAQSQQVAQALRALHPGLSVELVPIVTSGDRYLGSLHTAGGKGMFTLELETALRDGSVDLAVHSAKDLPAIIGEGLTISAVPLREDPRDALVTADGRAVEELSCGAVVGTSSLRRAMQLLARRGDLRIVPLRGNVETRLRKVLDERAADATVLAMAGLIRSGLLHTFRKSILPLDAQTFIPAAGQGALALQTAAKNAEVIELLSRLDHADSHAALLAEREVVRGLDADCHSSLAVHVRPFQGAWQGIAGASDRQGQNRCATTAQGKSAGEVGEELLKTLLLDGVASLLKS